MSVNNKPCGNSAAMREALENATKDLRNVVAEMRDDDCSKVSPSILRSGWANILECICVAIEAALAAPPRNCDFGTAEEQAERFGRYCDKFTRDGMHCETCPCCGKIPFGKCEFAWAQMPHEEGANA